MANERPKADVVIVGLGWAGSVMAEELTRAGLNVVAIERGKWRDTSTDFPPAVDPDELKWHTRRQMLAAPSRETYTFRNRSSQTAAPTREWSAFQFGENVGGAGTHWAGMSWRFSPWDFEVATRTEDRYGRARLDALRAEGLLLQDWGITYDDLAEDYDWFERIAGTSGIAGNLNGKIRPGGNPFEGPRSRDYPTPPLKDSYWMARYRDTTTRMGYHPFTIPAGNLGQAYVNPLGVSMGPCTYCGFCDFHGCGNYSKSSPQACILPVLMRRPNFTVLTETQALNAVKSDDGKTVTGVRYVGSDGQGEGFQPADIVISTAYQMDNVRLMLLSRIGEQYDPSTMQGTIGRNYNYQTCSSVTGYFDGAKMNPFISAGAMAVQIDDLNGDNFDHADLDFIGGAGMMSVQTQGRPIALANTLRPGTSRWGSGWKEGFSKSYNEAATLFNQGTSMSTRDAYLSLDPTYEDRFGQPLLRITFDWNRNDKAMMRHITDKAQSIMQEAGADAMTTDLQTENSWNPYTQMSSHTIGGLVMGADPTTSALNPYCQSWDCHNVFSVGANCFPNNAGYNPTVTIGALAIRAAKAIHSTYVNNPGPLVEA